MATSFTGWGGWGPGMAAGGGMTAPYGAFHCPACGYSGPVWHPGPSPSMGFGGGYTPAYYGWANGWGLGGLRRWGGSYSPQYAAAGLPTDEEMTEMIYDAIDSDPLIPYDAAIDVEVDAGEVTLSGTVANKDIKHAAGDDCWWVPGVVDVRNNLAVSGHRRLKSAPAETGRRPRAGSRRSGTGGPGPETL